MITLKTSELSLIFDEKRAAITSLSDGVQEFAAKERPIFEVALLDGKGERTRLDGDAFSLVEANRADGVFSAVYRNEKINCTIEIRETDEGFAFGASAQVLSSEYVTEWLNYPLFTLKNDLLDNGGNGKILWGFNEGVLIDSFRQRAGLPYREPNYPSLGLYGVYPGAVETQFMAYYNDCSGLYLAAHDTEDCFKGIDFYETEGGFLLQYRHFTGATFGEDYRIPYPMVLRGFQGDWYDAAAIYRAFFERERSGMLIPIKENKKLPDWYRNSPVIITYPVRGKHDADEMTPNRLFPYVNALPHIERLEKELESKIFVLLMHWEGSAPWAPPYVWPPYGGEKMLCDFIDALHARGDALGVYCSGIGWTQQSHTDPTYNKEAFFNENKLSEVMCTAPDGSLPFSNICTAQRRGYDLCPACRFTKDTVVNEVRSMANAGIDYIQLMDQNHGGTSYLCYSRTHGHPPVPGKWQTDAVKELYRQAASVAAGVLLGCESAAAESYLPYLLFSDNRYNVNYRIGQPVPVHAFLFHRYCNNFNGNQVCSQYNLDHNTFPDSLLLRTAHGFIAGDMLTQVINDEGDITWNWGGAPDTLPDQAAVKEFTRHLNGWRIRHPEYLHTGEMTKPFPVLCEQNSLFHPIQKMHSKTDCIYTSAWRTENGKLGQFLVNYNSTEQAFRIALPDGSYTLTDENGNVTKLSGGTHTITLPPIRAVLLEKA